MATFEDFYFDSSTERTRFTRSEDPVGDYGKGIQKACARFRKTGVKDVSIKLCEGDSHEMRNEINRDEVFCDILA